MYYEQNDKNFGHGKINMNTILTSKFDWTLDDIRIEKISRFLEYHGPRFEFKVIQLFYA